MLNNNYNFIVITFCFHDYNTHIFGKYNFILYIFPFIRNKNIFIRKLGIIDFSNFCLYGRNVLVITFFELVKVLVGIKYCKGITK